FLHGLLGVFYLLLPWRRLLLATPLLSSALLTTFLLASTLLSAFLHLLADLSGLVSNIILFASHLLEGFRRKRRDARRLFLKVGQGPFQVVECSLFVLLGSLPFALLQISLGPLLILNGLLQRFLSRLGWTRSLRRCLI